MCGINFHNDRRADDSIVLCGYCLYVEFKRKKYMKNIIITLVLLPSVLSAQFVQPTAGELILEMKRLSVLGSVLYVAAHPDDENTALLSYFSKEKLYRTAYLSITRGEGGQNAIGSELGAALGIIRTQELLAARRIDGAEQFFTRAIDFGYSKSSDETLRLWNKDSVLSDVVFVIRKFRPDIIITRFSPTQGGHGHHLSSAILAQEAFALSGDPAVFPEQLQYVQPWKAKRILFNHFRFGGAASNPQNLPSIKIDVGAYHPFLGRSYNELAGISRTMHKSQAMGSQQNKGSAPNEFVVTGGAPAANDVMEGIDISWNRIPHGKKINSMIRSVLQSFDPANPHKSIPGLVKVYTALQPINNDPLIDRKMYEIEQLIRACSGMWIEARAQDPTYTRGDSIAVTLTVLSRSLAPISLFSLSSQQLDVDRQSRHTLKFNEPHIVQLSSSIKPDEPWTQPYWLKTEPDGARYSTVDYTMIGSAQNPPPLSIAVLFEIEKTLIMFTVPVIYKWVDDIEGEKYRTVAIVPPVSIGIIEKNIAGNRSDHSVVSVRISALTKQVAGTVRLHMPNGWSVTNEQPFDLREAKREQTFRFYSRPDSAANSGAFIAEAIVDGKEYSTTVQTITYPHIPPQVMIERSKGRAFSIDLKKRGTSLGYIMGAGDEVPNGLEQMGYVVSPITDDELRTGNLSRFDVIVAGVRAYNVREQLRMSHDRVMEYVEKGGTYLVQYQVLERGQTDNIAPYPLEISRNRVTDESAVMKFIDANHPVVINPNRITDKDFDGWVQERGLYFAGTWDKRFEPMILCNDPNEKEQEGSLLIARYGKGHYIFTGLSFFRQLPAGVPGAYRLLANLLSIGK
jgi:LmbE family N-acetylglucosaminyl deacetylase